MIRDFINKSFQGSSEDIVSRKIQIDLSNESVDPTTYSEIVVEFMTPSGRIIQRKLPVGMFVRSEW